MDLERDLLGGLPSRRVRQRQRRTRSIQVKPDNRIGEDPVEAVRWYRLAAEQGEARAQNQLGFRYRFGRGVDQDGAEAAGGTASPPIKVTSTGS